MSERKKILWLVSWYPNKYDAFDGDFIQRHAKAAALYDDVHVIFVKQEAKQKKIEKEKKEYEGLTEEIIYLPKTNSLFGKIKNYKEWKKVYRNAVGEFIQKNKPSLIHVHIPWKAGLIATWAKKKFNVPYIITEHWGIYNKVVDDNIHTKSFVVRYLLKKIYEEASAFVSVSNYVGEGVNQTLIKKDFSVISNVVDTLLFQPSNNKYSSFTFLHASNMVPLKNVEGILHAFHQFLQTGNDAQLILVGNKDGYYERLAKQMGIPASSVFFKGEIAYADVAKEMQRSHVFILNSNIENSPCVIGEALCCGLPVIATNVGGIPELVNEHNGVLIPKNDNDLLKKAMTDVYQSISHYDKELIAEKAAQKFSPSFIGQQFHFLYSRI